MNASEILRCHVGTARQKTVSCKLLRDRAAALQSMSLVKIPNEGAGNQDRIQPMMRRE